MKKLIHHLRKQPEETRRHILHVLTIMVGIVLLLCWVYSLGTNLGSTETAADASKDLEPFSVLKNNLALPSW